MLTRLLTFALVAVSWRATDACSCSMEHPQTQFCKSDFVIVARVQKLYHNDGFYDSYKIKTRTVFKSTFKASVALSSGRILTPAPDSLCGVSLKLGETYVLTGQVVHLKAHINLCGYIKKWREVTSRQRKGFRLLYKQGCECKIHLHKRKKTRNTCVATEDSYCMERYGICLHDREGRCRWTRGPALTRCLQTATP